MNKSPVRASIEEAQHKAKRSTRETTQEKKKPISPLSAASL